jgi:2,4-dienoyl-CoA reductase-like NADH-dependent reductase (Old Yellow Enzyme family)
MRAIARPQPQAALLAHGLVHEFSLRVSMKELGFARDEWAAIYAHGLSNILSIQAQQQELRDRGLDQAVEDVGAAGVVGVMQLGPCTYDRERLVWRWAVQRVVRIDPLKVNPGWRPTRPWVLGDQEVAELRERFRKATTRAA